MELTSQEQPLKVSLQEAIVNIKNLYIMAKVPEATGRDHVLFQESISLLDRLVGEALIKDKTIAQ